MGTFSRQALATILFSALLGVVIGCSKHSNDEAIAQHVQRRLAADPVAEDSTIIVIVKDGEVTLKGAVKDSGTQRRVEEIAREEAGARDLTDETAVVAVPASEQTSSPTETRPAPPTIQEPNPEPIIVPAGATLTVTVNQELSSKSSRTGQAFLADLAQPVTVDGKTAMPKGSSVTGTVVAAKEKGKIKGEGQLTLALTNVTINGKNYAIRTATLDSTVKGKGKRTAATTGGGAAGGALIGGVAGGGKGAGIGGLVGAVGGFVGGALTGNKQVEIPAESVLTFTLSKPLTLPPHTD